MHFALNMDQSGCIVRNPNGVADRSRWASRQRLALCLADSPINRVSFFCSSEDTLLIQRSPDGLLEF